MAGAFFLAVERRLSVNGEQIAGGSYLETLPVSPLPFALAEARLGTQSAARAAVFGHAVAEEVTTTVTSDGVEDRAALGRGARESGHESVAENGAAIDPEMGILVGEVHDGVGRLCDAVEKDLTGRVRPDRPRDLTTRRGEEVPEDS